MRLGGLNEPKRPIAPKHDGLAGAVKRTGVGIRPPRHLGDLGVVAVAAHNRVVTPRRKAALGLGAERLRHLRLFVGAAQASAGDQGKALAEVAGKHLPERYRYGMAQQRAHPPVASTRRETVAVVNEEPPAAVVEVEVIKNDRRAQFVGEVRAVPRIVVAREDDKPSPVVDPPRQRPNEPGRQTRHECPVFHPRLEHIAHKQQRLGIGMRVEQPRESARRVVFVGEGTTPKVKVRGKKQHETTTGLWMAEGFREARNVEPTRKTRFQLPALPATSHVARSQPHHPMSPAALPLSDLRTERPRTAVAEGRVRVGEAAFQMLADGTLKDRDVLTMAQVAGLLGAKQTSRLLPLCHDVALRGLDVTIRLDESDYAVVIRASAKAVGATGVTMEAMTAVSVAALTVFDAVRSTAADAEITGLHLVAKTGGASGDYVRSR